jgi:hypothetical protein
MEILKQSKMKKIIQKEVVKIKEHKKDCGFRNEMKTCYAKVSQCNKTDCDLYLVDWNSKSIKKQIHYENNFIKKLKSKVKIIGKKKSLNEDDLKLRALVMDRIIGINVLSKAYILLKRSGR